MVLQRAATPHRQSAVVPFQQLNNALTFQQELHPNMQETANERADDHLAGKKNPKTTKPHFLDIKL